MTKAVKPFLAFLVAGTLSVAPSYAYAHSNELNSAAVSFDPVKTEFGEYDPGMHASRTIEIKMTDEMRFTPALIRVKKGDVIKFTHVNVGNLMHEFVLGTEASLDEHAELMKKFPNMEHEEPYMAHVPPGETGVVTWKFSVPGEVSFGCLIPGHYDAGMKGKIIVES